MQNHIEEAISALMVRFVSRKDEKKVIVVNVGVEGYNNYITGKYRETIQFTDEQLGCLLSDKLTVYLLTQNRSSADFSTIFHTFLR